MARWRPVGDSARESVDEVCAGRECSGERAGQAHILTAPSPVLRRTWAHECEKTHWFVCTDCGCSARMRICQPVDDGGVGVVDGPLLLLLLL